jgi:hypothetical protein
MSVLLGLRASLEEILTDQLGTYTLANGATTAAVRVSSPDDRRQPGTTVSGIELVIVQEPTLVPIRQYEQEGSFAEWTAYLVGWGDNESVLTSAQLIIAALPGCSFDPVTVPEGVGPRNQVKLTIRPSILTTEADFISVLISALLLEDGGYLLLEDGGKILQEA